MNDQILGLLDEDYTTYLCDDSVETEDDGEHLNFTIEFLNSISPSGMPQHRLRLKRIYNISIKYICVLMASVSVIKSSRGCDLLVVEKFQFCKQDVLKSGEVRWRCIKKNLRCLAKLYTVGAEYTVTRSELIHNHESDETTLERKIVTTSCKRKAEEDISEKPSKIIKSVLSNDLPENLSSTDVSLIRRNLYNSRRKLLPALPKDIHDEVFVDFEIAIHNALKVVFPTTKLSGCRFHLHQAWYRKIQSLGLTQMYKDKNCEESKWLTHTFGLTYLDPSEVEDCFIFDLMSHKPDHKLIDKYADYLLENYIAPESHFPPNIWAYENPSIKRTTNTCESFHSHFNSSFYSSHPSIFIFIEKLKDCQIDAYLKIKNLNIPNIYVQYI
nr:unnamed protein product [Callosobruchus analis]